MLAGCAPKPPVLGELPDFELTSVSSDGAGRPMRRADLLGKTWVAGFLFTRCAGPCPALASQLAKLQRDLPASASLLTFTVDPDRDDVPTLARYARSLRADPARWRFVTGPKPRVYDLLIGGFKLPVVEDPSAPSDRRVTHSTRLALLDAQARLRGYYDGDDDAALNRLARDLSRVRE
jgi:protein SCO1